MPFSGVAFFGACADAIDVVPRNTRLIRIVSTRAGFITTSIIRISSGPPAERRAVDLLAAAVRPLTLEILGVLSRPRVDAHHDAAFPDAPVVMTSPILGNAVPD